MKKNPPPKLGPSWSWALAAAAVAFLVFLPMLKHGFVSYDDDSFLYLNPHFRGLGWTQLSWMFTTFLRGPYQPIVWMSYAADYLLWGMDPMAFHLTSLLWHCANTALTFLLLRRLVWAAAPESAPALRDWAALFAALAFALHPLRVEPVAWATARRDLMSGFFILCAALCHLEGRKRMTLACYCLSLLAKPMGVGLPLVLFFLDGLLLKKERSWRSLLPYGPPAAAAVWLAWHGQVATGAAVPAEFFGWPQRLAQAFYAHAFCLVKTVWPAGLAPIYERALRFDPLGPRFLASAALGAAVAAAAFALRRRWPAAWTAWLSYLILLTPVLGAVKFGNQLVADRYSYLPGLALSLLAGAGLLRLLAAPRARRWAGACACALILVLAVLCRRQLGFWQDSESLYLRVLAVDPAEAVAHNNLGLVYDHQGRLPEALEQYRLSLQCRPGFASALNNLGAAFIKLGRLDEAEARFREAMASDPKLVDAYNNLALILAERKRYDEAVALFDAALRLDPGYARAASNKDLILRMKAARGP